MSKEDINPKYSDGKGMKKKKTKHAFEQLHDKQCPQGIAKFQYSNDQC